MSNQLLDFNGYNPKDFLGKSAFKVDTNDLSSASTLIDAIGCLVLLGFFFSYKSISIHFNDLSLMSTWMWMLMICQQRPH
jgi:hypothetical protein